MGSLSVGSEAIREGNKAPEFSESLSRWNTKDKLVGRTMYHIVFNLENVNIFTLNS